ncbi:hypothetical protein [Streptomyces roseolus]|uniref:hypothetical protein n=1 Tax=Streptomyces roseolus TaxID=67358 RepID=UPI003F4CC58F
MTGLPRITGIDGHVIEPAHLFGTWLPAKYRDRGPRALTAGEVPDHGGPGRPPTGGSTRT